jgi:Caspase domain
LRTGRLFSFSRILRASGSSPAKATSVSFLNFVSWAVLAVFAGIPAFAQGSQPQIHEKLPDGVEHWYVSASGNGESAFTRGFEQVYEVLFDKAHQPFGRSIAFLVGVSKYQNLSPQLPSVHNDIVEMRNLLINKAGFDEVYVAEDDAVNRDLIEQYVKGILAARMTKNDRLLFYYSGHGGDNQGSTDYMLFGKAKKGQFWGQQVLPVDALRDWSRELQIQHILFILDSCASGLEFTSKGTPAATDKLLRTLSGNGSRTVLTAGTADESAYAFEDRNLLGNGVFTKALIYAFDSRFLSDTPLITVADLFADIEKQMAEFRANSGKPTTPKIWPLQEADYRGTFVFLNTRVQTARLTQEQAEALGISLVSKTANSPLESASGILEVSSSIPGSLTIDGQDMGEIFAGETRQFMQQHLGKRQIQFQPRQIFREASIKPSEVAEVTVEVGRIGYAAFGLQSPIDESGRTPVGTLLVQSIHNLSGEVFVDDVVVGQVQKDGELTVANVTAGPHRWRIGTLEEGATGTFVINPNETTPAVWMPPRPPSGLSASVQ